jgi:hypothetical protein
VRAITALSRCRTLLQAGVFGRLIARSTPSSARWNVRCVPLVQAEKKFRVGDAREPQLRKSSE